MLSYNDMNTMVSTLRNLQAPLIKSQVSPNMSKALDDVIHIIEREMDLYEFENAEIEGRD